MKISIFLALVITTRARENRAVKNVVNPKRMGLDLMLYNTTMEAIGTTEAITVVRISSSWLILESRYSKTPTPEEELGMADCCRIVIFYTNEDYAGFNLTFNLSPSSR
jgi:hypothetical protein